MTSSPDNISRRRPVAGLLPAAGRTPGLGALPCSREILPIRIDEGEENAGAVEVASSSVLRAMAGAGIAEAHFLIDREKLDIATYWGSGGPSGIALAYHLMEDAPTTVAALASAAPFLRDRMVAFGYPAVVYEAPGMFTQLLSRMEGTDADIVLALFPTGDPAKVDTVNISRDGVVREIRVRSAASPFEWAWGAAVWKPTFTERLSVAVSPQEPDAGQIGEGYLGDLINHARRNGLMIDSMWFPEGHFSPIDAPRDWQRLLLEEPGKTDAAPQARATDTHIPSLQTTRQP